MSKRTYWLIGLPLAAVFGCAPVDSSPLPTPSGAAAVGGETLPSRPDDGLPPAKPRPGRAAAAVPVSLPDDKDLSKKSVEELLGLATSTFDPDRRVKILEVLLDKDPENREALFMALVTTQRQAIKIGLEQGDRPASCPIFMKSGEFARRLRAAHPEPANQDEANYISQALYNAACTLAIQDQPDEAMEYLTQAIDAGFNDPVMKDDPEIDTLRKRPDFLALKERQARVAAERARRSPQVDERAIARAGREVAVELENFKSFPFDFELEDLDGKPLALEDYRGKVLIVDLWGTWCGPCQEEIPQFVRLHEKYKEKGLAIVGINFEHAEGEEAKKLVRDFMEEYKIPYPCALGDKDWFETIPGATGYPTTLFIDRAGKVRLREVGYSSEMAPKLEAIVRALLDEGAVEAE